MFELNTEIEADVSDLLRGHEEHRAPVEARPVPARRSSRTRSGARP